MAPIHPTSRSCFQIAANLPNATPGLIHPIIPNPPAFTAITPTISKPLILSAVDDNGTEKFVITHSGDIHKIITNFDYYAKISPYDSIKVNGVYLNLWDELQTYPGIITKGRHLYINEAIAGLIKMYVEHFNDYANLTLCEFLNHFNEEPNGKSS